MCLRDRNFSSFCHEDGSVNADTYGCDPETKGCPACAGKHRPHLQTRPRNKRHKAPESGPPDAVGAQPDAEGTPQPSTASSLGGGQQEPLPRPDELSEEVVEEPPAAEPAPLLREEPAPPPEEEAIVPAE